MLRVKNILVFLTVFVLFVSSEVSATHLRAAEITAKRLSPTTYQITLILFADWENVFDNPNAVVPNDMLFQVVNIQGVNYQVERNNSEVFGSETYKTLMNTYVFNYTFSSVGSAYTISFVENFRNGGIANINDGNSKEVPLHVSLILKPAVSDETNSSPELLIPPIDEAAVDRVYTHNPGAYDPDGDSLSYRLVTPTREVGVLVPGYRSPADPYYGAGSTISVNPLTGDLVWDSPKQVGIYNVAIEVTEWGTSPLGAYVKSKIVRDMQINVVESSNTPPVIIAPSDTCVEAGKLFKTRFSGYDPDGDALSQTKFGGPLSEGARFDFATFNTTKDTLYSIDFLWEPTCEIVGDQLNAVTFKLTDDYPLSLSTLHTYQIKVNLPAPEVTSIEDIGEALRVVWSEYLCSNSLEKVKVWRIDCDTSNVNYSSCVTGVPESWGAVLVGEVTNGDTSFVDSNVEIGTRYCYILTAIGENNQESVASNIMCGALKLTAPLITRVSVLKTSETNGKVEVAWMKPIEVDTTINKGPFRYDVYRSDDDGLTFLSNSIYTLSLPNLEGGSFVDSLINTQDNKYVYKIDFFNNGEKVATSHEASDIFVKANSRFERIDLNISNTSVWQFPDSLVNIVYREIGDSIVVFDTLKGGLENQSIEGLNNGEEYCFFIELQNTFCSIDTPEQPFKNKTNTFCIVPFDSTAPCPPVLTIDDLVCEDLDENVSLSTNQLLWTGGYEDDSNCENDVVKFNMYHQATLGTDFELLEEFDSLTFSFDHVREMNRAGCYYIEAVDLVGLVSDRSNVVCNDNCELIEFPNVITPNGDFKNDFFIPIPEPRNVESIVFEVYNRLGKLVYRGSDDPSINWGGVGFNGDLLSSGMYYWTAAVTFYKLNAEEKEQVFNGWVLINR